METLLPGIRFNLLPAVSKLNLFCAKSDKNFGNLFYQELEEKKAHTDNRVEADLVEEEQEREDAISDIQVDVGAAPPQVL